ncbi:hypothetical protein LLG46_13490 [bacterium]|nr:hypothetical protein [bacterium]
MDGKGECSGYKYGVHVGTTWAFSILSNYTGPIADRKTIASPGRRGAPTYPARPSFSPVHGGCQEGDDPVDLATGEHVYIPCADISVYNPYGPGIVYQRNFLSKVAKEGYASAGQSVGWVDTYDVSMTSSDAQTWSDLTLRYPNSAEEDMTPVLDNDEPTGEFTEPTGSEFIVTGVPSGTTGQWQSISITFKDQTVWTFTPKAADSYVLTRISNRMGRYITINRDSNNNYQVTSIVDDSTPANSLLSFVYTNGYLTSVTDAYNRKVIYSYGSSAGTTCLLSTSQIGNVSDSAIPARWTYGYTAYVDPANPMGPAQPHVTSVSFPSPTGSGMSTETFNYNSDAQVESIVDDNGNQTEFSYKYTDGTIVSIKNLQDVVESQWIANFDPANGNIDTGITDATGYDIAYLYEDSTNPTKITKIVDQKRQETSLAYDQYGNITSTTTPRDTTTTYTYDYNNFALGRLTSIQEGTKPATTFTYYEPSGLVNTVVGPKPGTTGGSETVSTSFTYDSLGNVLTKVAPGNNATQTITTTYNYTTDGIYTQSAKIGQPVTITDQLGHITHIRYDSRGNVTESTDAIGNTTSFMYNIADQLSDIIHPVIP